MTKKNVLWSSSIITIGLFALNYFQGLPMCRQEWSGCVHAIYILGTTFVPFLALTIFSLITYKMKEEVFVRWWKFTRWWTPLSMVIIAISPQYADSFMMAPSPKGLAVVGTGGLFILISVIIILRTWLKTRKEGK